MEARSDDEAPGVPSPTYPVLFVPNLQQVVDCRYFETVFVCWCETKANSLQTLPEAPPVYKGALWIVRKLSDRDERVPVIYI